jgi:Family of unknown function (DUF6460)
LQRAEQRYGRIRRIEPMNLRDFIGGSPLAVAFRLAVLSVLVGLLLSFLGITPRNFFRVIDDFARSVYDMGFGAITWMLDYLVLGAMLVIPLWLLIRLLRARPSNGN